MDSAFGLDLLSMRATSSALFNLEYPLRPCSLAMDLSSLTVWSERFGFVVEDLGFSDERVRGLVQAPPGNLGKDGICLLRMCTRTCNYFSIREISLLLGDYY